ncbi:MAG TPA: hypothetical protein VF457_09055, partial [Burkholderiaceae bacterium]
SAADGSCAAGPLVQTPLDGSAALMLGTVPTATAWMRGDGVQGLAGALSGQTFLATPAGFGSGETADRDAWQLTPGSAGSLSRSTTYLP